MIADLLDYCNLLPAWWHARRPWTRPPTVPDRRAPLTEWDPWDNRAELPPTDAVVRCFPGSRPRSRPSLSLVGGTLSRPLQQRATSADEIWTPLDHRMDGSLFRRIKRPVNSTGPRSNGKPDCRIIGSRSWSIAGRMVDRVGDSMNGCITWRIYH